MDRIEKLLRKISKKDREKLFGIIDRLLNGEKKGLNIKKLKGAEFYRKTACPGEKIETGRRARARLRRI